MALSPLNHILYDNLSKGVDFEAATAFTFEDNISLNLVSKTNQSFEYSIPSLTNSGPIALAMTWTNGSSTFGDFVMYPQIPLDAGPNFDESVTGSKVSAANYVVSCNGALYQVVMRWSGTA